jgi:hypothetical protein
MPAQNDRLLQTGIMGYYVPHKMWVLLGVSLALIFMMRDDLYARFQAHAELNGIIIGLAVIVVFLAFYNAFKVQIAANLLKRIEKFEDNPTEEDRQKIIHDLRHRGHFIDNFYLQGILVRHTHGNIVFDDTQARLIKSKVGQRATHMKNSVQYLAGVLVMLGLIGTFYGLLETITAVGDAMTKITESFAASSSSTETDQGVGGGGMVEFIKAISKPLQGMGIAFSASLFGLSGSLLGGLLNSFCAKGMDRFIENFSVWLDTRIPISKPKEQQKLDPVALIEQHNATVVKALEQALGTMSQQAQQMFVNLTGVMSELTQFSQQQKALTAQLGNDSRINIRLADAMETAVLGLRHDTQQMRGAVAVLPEIHQQVNDNLRSLHTLLGGTHEAMLAEQKRIGTHLAESTRQQSTHVSSIDRLVESYAAIVTLQGRIVEVMQAVASSDGDQNPSLDMIIQIQNDLQNQIKGRDILKDVFIENTRMKI